MKKISGSVTAPQGFLAQGVCADLKKSDKKDIALIYSEVPCAATGTFTTNVVRASCVDISRQHLANGRAQAIVVNRAMPMPVLANRVGMILCRWPRSLPRALI